MKPRPIVMSLTLTAALAASTAAAQSPPAEPSAETPGPAPPVTEVREVVETLHGLEIRDPYRWLEAGSAPEVEGDSAALDAEVDRWTDLQNEYTRLRLDGLPGRAELEERFRDLLEIGFVSAPAMARDRYFYFERQGDQAQPVVRVRQGHDGEPRLLLDPNTLDEEGLTTVSWIEPSQDGELLAFGLFARGDENSTLYVLSVDDGVWLPEEIPGKVEDVDWMPDGSGFFYRRLADLDNPYSGQIKYHRLGTHHRHDPVLFEQEKEGPLATTWGPGASISRDGRWMILYYWTGTDSNDVWVVDLDRWFREGEFVRREIVTGERATSFGQVIGDTLYLRTSLDAPNGRLVAVDLHRPGDRDAWREVLPEREGAVLRGVSPARGLLVANYLENATTRLELFRYDGERVGEIPLPGLGSAFVATEPDRTEAFLTFESFNRPESIYRIDLAEATSGERELWAAPEVEVDSESIAVEQVFFRSKDGTRVPMFLVHRKGLELDGDQPTLLTGYGGFNISRTPSFSATLLPWIEGGGVYALANLRGGGEYGEAWHRAGMLERKQNVFDDFLAAARWLIDNRYTSPEHLAIAGGSNGGLLTGAALTQAPELFTAVVSAVPLLDMVRYHHFLMARYWVPEYGSSEDPEELPFLLGYSPYHNIEEDVAYPAVLLTAGENDVRVHPLHARKMAARLQAATVSDPAEEPILLWIERAAGHGGGKPLELRVQEVTDRMIFLMWQTGMLPRVEPEAAAAVATD